MKPDVEQAIDELRDGAPSTGLSFKEDDDGGAFVLTEGVAIGESFAPSVSWVGFRITFPYPDADVYPHFVDAGLRYIGEGDTPNLHPEGDLPKAMSRGDFLAPGFDLPAIQVSRASNRRNVEADTALQKLLRVIEFLRTR